MEVDVDHNAARWQRRATGFAFVPVLTVFAVTILPKCASPSTFDEVPLRNEHRTVRSNEGSVRLYAGALALSLPLRPNALLIAPTDYHDQTQAYCCTCQQRFIFH